jgi:hypothetical protein
VGRDPELGEVARPIVERIVLELIAGRTFRRSDFHQETVHGDTAVLCPEWVTDVLRPTLAIAKLSAVMAACGVTKSTASSWRNGKTSVRDQRTSRSVINESRGELTGLAPQREC